jgi:pantoate--beta-alanine ligase
VLDLRAQVARWRQEGLRVALVPTMWALHQGHLSLVRLARQQADRIIVSIFVNPTQFAPHEDFGSYPRTFDQDMALLAQEQVECVYAPLAAEIYPPGFDLSIILGGPATAGLEDRFRPTFFHGVATVVAKLLIQSAPDIALFGEKDFQQLAVIRKLVRDLDLPVNVIGGPTIRETDGLALSSRNIYLSPQERHTAAQIHACLQEVRSAVLKGDDVEKACDLAKSQLQKTGFVVDYLEYRDAVTLGPAGSTPCRLLVAAKLGPTRLIDNIGIED